jgi:hypothetical protein
MATAVAALAGVALVACGGGSAPDARYPAHEDGCPVKAYPGPASIPVDDLGVVQVECGPAGRGACERQLENAVCHRGGDVVWGMADNSLTATTLTAHAAHSHRAMTGPRERGCNVSVFPGMPPMQVENVGPVTALCSPDDNRDVCLRELQDQVCLMGGDLVWQIEGPAPEDTSNGPKQRMRGRAAHTK